MAVSDWQKAFWESTRGQIFDRLRGKKRGVSAWIKFPLRMLSLDQLDIDFAMVGFWARVLLAATLGVLMTQWPYRHECGWGLAGYFGAIVMVLMSAAWIALASWKLRSASAHLLALLLFFWGLVLAADEVLPRIGYSVAEASWGCR